MKPSIPRGTRDFGPAEMQKRQYIFDIVKANFRLFGFAPIETPSMENISTLTGKYGEEGDQLIFKILNSRIHESKEDKKEELRQEFDASIQRPYNTELLTEKALRYDLTVPFARYVVMNHNKLAYPFKRYQIQPVWRADKPQKGRYREFYQCDADVIGSDSLVNELELLSMMDKTFHELNIPVLIKFNNRKILSGIAEILNSSDKIIDITVAIDKLDKIGKDGVIKELAEKGISPESIEKLKPLIDLSGSNEEKLKVLTQFLSHSEIGKKGIEEIYFLLDHLRTIAIKHATIEMDITLARGLNYYTGTIFEAKANAGTFTPSILGGGRYDDLTGIFGLKGLSGVGISFGIDRIYDVMEELELFPESINKSSTTKVLLANFGKAELMHCLTLASKLRTAGINAEVYPDVVKKIGKQFEYADKKQIPFVGVIGSNEMEKNTVMLKDMSAGTQEELNHDQLIARLK
ncbi:MAG: histidyl-tRNA synthase [Bacteroidota bacterium]|jgi:histidyl-tRNA synthetase|nr:histidyl-tRNA synthase [Bacteroidota bacterium]